MSITFDGTIYEELSVDVSQQNEFAPRLVKQGDAYTRGYIITLTENGEPLTIPTANTTAWFNCRNMTDETKRASATGTINSNGTVTVKVPTVVMEVAGFIQCDISIITASGNDTNILKSTLFYLNCEEAANPDGTTTAAEDSILAGIVAGTIDLPTGSYVPKARKVAGIDLEDDITAAELKNALSVPTKTTDLINDSGFLTAHQDISGKVDKTQTIAGLALSGSIGSAALAEAMASNINPVGVIDGTTSGYGAQFGRSSAGKPVMHTLGKDWEELALASDVSGKQDKQTTVPTVGTTEEQGRWVVDTSDSVFRGLSIGQLFKAEISEVYHTYQKTSVSDYIKISDILHDGDIPTNVSAFNNDAGYLTQHQVVSGKMDLASVRASIDDDTQIKQGQFLVVGGEVWIKTATLGAAGHKILEDTSNKVTSISDSSNDAQYPSALAVKNYVDSILGTIETELSQI